MNRPSVNSGGVADPVPRTPALEFFLVLPDGSCTPATRDTCRIVMRQVRSEARKQARIRRREKAVELQMALEDRAAARSVQQELAELHRGSIRWAARFKIRVEPDASESRTSPVTKRLIGSASKGTGRAAGLPRPASSWAIDARGMKGVIWQQSYLGRKSPGFHRGKARENWEYIARDEAVLLDAAGEPVIISNMGDDWVEIGVAWQAMEDASTRANAKIQILAIAPFDSDMSDAEMIAALGHFCKTVLGPLGLPYSAAIHAPSEHGDQRNFHPHIAFSLRPMRRIERYCWEVADDVCDDLDGRDGVQALRHLWAHSMSAAAEEARSNRRYTGLGYGARGLDLEAGEHLGEARSAILQRGGHVWAHERNRIKAARNAARRVIRDCDRKIEALTKVRDAAVRRIEQRADGVVAARIIRAVPPAEAAETRAQPFVARPAAVTTAARAARSTRTFEPASPSLARRSFKAAVPSVAATMITSPDATASSTMRSPTGPALPARRLTTSRPVAPSGRFHRAPAPKSIVAFRASEQSRAALPFAAAETSIPARTRSTATSGRSRTERFAHKPVMIATNDNAAHLLFGALAFARAARTRRRQRTVPGDLRIDTLPMLGDLPTLDALPDLDRLAVEAGSATMTVDPLSVEDRGRLDRLSALDPYVAAYDGEAGRVETDYPALKTIGVGWDWFDAPGVQQALRALRAAQQQVAADLVREAAVRPLAFGKTGTRFWPRDLPAEQLRRLDRWANDPGFEHDMTETRWSIEQAHSVRDVELRAARRSEGVGDEVAPQYPDGFGGMRAIPPPVFAGDRSPVRLEPFDATGEPTVHLLRLLHLAGIHPLGIVIASDGRLTVEGKTPAMLAPLLHGWRDDDGVAALVTQTVRDSRAAGQPVWPDSVARAVRMFAIGEAGTSGVVTGRTVGRSLPDPDSSLSR